MEIWYTCRTAFGPADGARWQDYVRWSGLDHLLEVLSLDTILCPNVIDPLTDEDWSHNVHQDFLIGFFRDFDYLQERTRILQGRKNLFAVCREPDQDAPPLLNDSHFMFLGYDLLDEWASNSLLTNCGGFENAFANSELSNIGLLTDYAYARTVQTRLREFYSANAHTNCDVWAVWKYIGPDK